MVVFHQCNARAYAALRKGGGRIWYIGDLTITSCGIVQGGGGGSFEPIDPPPPPHVN